MASTDLLCSLFTPFPFGPDVTESILTNRSVNELIIDSLLSQAEVSAVYPPDSSDALNELITAISLSPWDSLKKSALYFYLLNFVSFSVAERYAATQALPPQYIHLAHAYFLLDSRTPSDLTCAISLLSDARISPDMSSEILHTLSLAPQPLSSRLIRTYVRTAHPILVDYDDLAIYIRALLDHSIVDAWTFQRSFSETSPLRDQLIRTILDGCLIPPKPSALAPLLSLPLTSFEFSLLESYALTPPPSLPPASLAILHDLITVRLLHAGKYSDAIRISRAIHVDTRAQDRQRMVQDVLAVIPSIQRHQLELELDSHDSAMEASDEGAMSWENIASMAKSTSAQISVPHPHSGRLEGSPAPRLSALRRPPASPHTLFSSSFGQKRSIGVNGTGTSTSTGIFDAQTTSAKLQPKPNPPLIPASAKLTPSAQFQPRSHPLPQLQSSFHPPQRHNPSSGVNVFGPGATGGSLFSQSQSRVQKNDTSAVNGNRNHMEDIEMDMVGSDDPDAFVMRGTAGGRRVSSTPHANGTTHEYDDDADTDANASTSSLFGRRTSGSSSHPYSYSNSRQRSASQSQTAAVPATTTPKTVPGGFTLFEGEMDGGTGFNNDVYGQSHGQGQGRHPTRSQQPHSTRPSIFQGQTRTHDPNPNAVDATEDLQVRGNKTDTGYQYQNENEPGAEEQDENNEEDEEHDTVPSLPASPSKRKSAAAATSKGKGKGKGKLSKSKATASTSTFSPSTPNPKNKPASQPRTRTRTSTSTRASSVTESEDDDAPREVRRSSRLSSVGPASGTESRSPIKGKKGAKKGKNAYESGSEGGKKAGRSAGGSASEGGTGTGRTTRKRKNDEV